MAHTGRLSEEQVRELREWASMWANDPEFRPDGANEEGSFARVARVCAEVVSAREALAARDAALRSLEELATKSVHEGWVRAEPVLLTVRAALAGAVVEGAAE